MKYGDLKLGVEYAVIPSWDYSSADKKDASRVQRRDVAKATLVNLDKYEYKVFRFDSPDNPNFQPAPKGARSVGMLVQSDAWKSPNDPTASPTFWIARPQDIVAEYATLESRWNEEERVQREHEEQQRKEREIQQRKEQEARERATRNLNAIRESLTSILGSDRASRVQSDVTNRRDANGNYMPIASFTFDDRTLGVLIEKVLEARDLVG